MINFQPTVLLPAEMIYIYSITRVPVLYALNGFLIIFIQQRIDCGLLHLVCCQAYSNQKGQDLGGACPTNMQLLWGKSKVVQDVYDNKSNAGIICYVGFYQLYILPKIKGKKQIQNLPSFYFMSSIQQNSMFSLMPYLENCPFFSLQIR